MQSLPTLKSSWQQGLELFSANLTGAGDAGCEYPQYADDPVKFGVEVLGDKYTPDVQQVMYSVRDNIVTVAKSANATGKCVAYGEDIPLADGRVVSAESLIGQEFLVFSASPELSIKQSVGMAAENGVQAVVKITTETGTEIIRTLNHPLLRGEIWTPASDLRVGDSLLATNAKFSPAGLASAPTELFETRIKSIEPAGDMPTVAITVPGDETFLTGLVEHNTHSAARLAVWFFKCFPNSQVYTAAAPPEGNLKRLLWGEINGIIRRHKKLFEADRVISLHVERDPQSFITGVTIPLSGTPEERESKFCAAADDLFELTTGKVVTYQSLIGQTVDVFSVDEQFNISPARAEFFDNGVEDVYEIVLSSGQKILRTGGHPLYAGEIGQSFKKTEGHVKGRSLVQNEGWQPVQSLQSGQALLIPENTGFNFGSGRLDSNELKVLGYLIGDGDISSRKRVLFIQEDNKQLAEFKQAATALGGRVLAYDPAEYSWQVRGDGSGDVGSNPLLNLLRRHGLLGKKSGTKFIPEAINQLAPQDLALFLNRLYSTDGWACICKCGKYQKAEIGYCSKSERLVRDVARLLFRFGIASIIVRRKVTWEHKGEEKSGIYWNCIISRAGDILSFADKIGIYGKEEAVKLCENYAKSAGAYATWRKSNHPGFLWDKIKSIRKVGAQPTVGVYVPGNHTYLTGLVEHNSGKHAPHLFFILDEGDAIPNEVYRGIESCMSGGHVRMLIMFNPRRKFGPVYLMETKKQANICSLSAFRHPNVVTGRDEYPGAVKQSETVRRVNEWSRPLSEGEDPDSQCFEVPVYLTGIVAHARSGEAYPPLPGGWRRVTDPQLSYMVIGDYPSTGANQLIDEDWITQARSRYDQFIAEHGGPPKLRPDMGFDVADEGDCENALCFRYGNFVAPLIVWGGIDVDASADKAADFYRGRQAKAAMIDGTGIGASVPPKMRKQLDHTGKKWIKAVKVQVSSRAKRKPPDKTLGEFYNERAELWWMLREWLRTEPAMLPPDEMLIEELLVPTFDKVGGRVIIMPKKEMKKYLPNRRSPDRAESLMLTFARASIGWAWGMGEGGGA